jgi:hypothetical protein
MRCRIQNPHCISPLDRPDARGKSVYFLAFFVSDSIGVPEAPLRRFLAAQDTMDGGALRETFASHANSV